MIKNKQNKLREYAHLVESEKIVDTYFKTQYHENFEQFFTEVIEKRSESNFIQITTHSKLLSHNDLKQLSNKDTLVRHEALVAFDTQQQFVQVLDDFFHPCDQSKALKHVLIIQCDCGHLYQEIIKCAR